MTRLEHGPSLLLRWAEEGGGGAPTVAVAASLLSFDIETARDLAAVLGEVPPATFVTDIRLSGLRQTSVVWQASRLENKSTGTVAEWGGLDGLITHAPRGPVRGHLNGSGFGWSGPAGTFAVEGFELDFDGTDDHEGVWSGELEQRWRGVVWEPAGASPHEPSTEDRTRRIDMAAAEGAVEAGRAPDAADEVGAMGEVVAKGEVGAKSELVATSGRVAEVDGDGAAPTEGGIAPRRDDATVAEGGAVAETVVAADSAVVAESAAVGRARDYDWSGRFKQGSWAAHDLRITHVASRDGEELDWRFDIRVAGGAMAGRAFDSILGSLRLRHLAAVPAQAGALDAGPVPDLLAVLEPHLARGVAIDPFMVEIAGPDGELALEGSLRVDSEHPAAGHPVTALDALQGRVQLTHTGTLGEALGLTPEVVAELERAGLAAYRGDALVAPLVLANGELRVASELVASGGSAEAEPGVDGEGMVETETETEPETLRVADEAGLEQKEERMAGEAIAAEEPAADAVAVREPSPEPAKVSPERSEEDLMADLIAAEDRRNAPEAVPAAPASPAEP